tara:strand:+ start:1616 stop:2167 length:552 start_codon:yes stop_codon:yes gene_type:complete
MSVGYTYNIDPTKKNNKKKKQFSNFIITLKGVFLAFVLFFSSFLSPYIGCNYQSIMHSNTRLRQFVLFIVIYFSINLVDPNKKGVEHPIMGILKTIGVYIMFTLLSNIEIEATILMLVLLTLLVMISKFNSYYEFTELTKHDRKKYNDITSIFEIGIGISICLVLVMSLVSRKNITLKLEKCH